MGHAAERSAILAKRLGKTDLGYKNCHDSGK
jgi:hypothetical protein